VKSFSKDSNFFGFALEREDHDKETTLMTKI
jgi:hypothetical protein